MNEQQNRGKGEKKDLREPKMVEQKGRGSWGQEKGPLCFTTPTSDVMESILSYMPKFFATHTAVYISFQRFSELSFDESLNSIKGSR